MQNLPSAVRLILYLYCYSFNRRLYTSLSQATVLLRKERGGEVDQVDYVATFNGKKQNKNKTLANIYLHFSHCSRLLSFKITNS